MSITDTTTEDLRTDEPVDTAGPEAPAAAGAVEAELLVEEVSIDGMCGVY